MNYIDIALLEKSFQEISRVLSSIQQEDGMKRSFFRTLCYLFNHNDLSVRRLVIITAADKLKDKHVTKAQLRQIELLLVIGLSDKDTRCDALEGLSYFSDDNLLPLYGGILLNDSNKLVRVQAAENLSCSNDKAAIPFLEAALKDKSYLVRMYSAYGLGRLNSYNSIDKLTKLENTSRNMQIKTACAGGLLLLTGEKIWLDKLLGALSDDNYYVPMNAIVYIEDAIDNGLTTFDVVSKTVRKSLKKQNHKPTYLRIKDFIKRFSQADIV
jgi:HEAT repeats